MWIYTLSEEKKTKEKLNQSRKQTVYGMYVLLTSVLPLANKFELCFKTLFGLRVVVVQGNKISIYIMEVNPLSLSFKHLSAVLKIIAHVQPGARDRQLLQIVDMRQAFLLVLYTAFPPLESLTWHV